MHRGITPYRLQHLDTVILNTFLCMTSVVTAAPIKSTEPLVSHKMRQMSGEFVQFTSHINMPCDGADIGVNI
jgi:hypothetical protein